MNYWHAYHAGGYPEVFKHAVLVLLIEHFKKKEAPFFVLDTHAGAAAYDLDSEEASKTGEAQRGIRQIASKTIPAAAAYLEIVRAQNKNKLRYYPGSPKIIEAMLRPQDRMLACEITERAGVLLRRSLHTRKNVSIQIRNGYIAMKASLPPIERRGLVFIDPPFEVKNEFEQLVSALQDGLRRWRTGVYVAWYPVKDDRAVARFRNELTRLDCDFLFAEFLRDPEAQEQLKGSGMAIANPPWQTAEKIMTLGEELLRAFDAHGGKCSVVG